MADAGMLLANRYRLQEQFAAGGIAEAWRALDLPLGRPVAVRLLRARRRVNAERFLEVARRAARVLHPGIARVHDYGQSNPGRVPFLVTEPMTASSLATLTQAGPLDSPWVLEVLRQVSSALEAAHAEGLVHGDIKPMNLMLAPGGAVKLTGFGLSDVGEPTGTPAGDLYSLGLVVWECLTGTPPFSAAPPEGAPEQESRPLPPLPGTVPADVSALLADLTAADPKARPASAAEVAARSRELLAAPMRAGESCRISRPGATPLLDPPARRWAGDLAEVSRSSR